jgi:very-short-patch-repair endonuclease
MRRDIHETRDIRGKRESRGVELRIEGIAAEQHGLICRAQLADLGLGEDAIDHRLTLGRLIRVHRGVYAVGHRLLTQRGRWLAAVLAAGEGAVLSHRSAAGLWGLPASGGRDIDVTVPSNRRATDGIAIHRTKLDPSEITKRGPIAVTTPTRTLLDLASQIEGPPLERAIREAIYLRLTSTASLARCLSQHQGRRGSRVLRSALPETAGRMRSDLERDFIAFLRRHRLPLPELNAVIEGKEVDCVWRAKRLIVELDGGAAHDTPHAFEEDRARDADLLAAGWPVMRITSRRLTIHATALREHLARLLA